MARIAIIGGGSMGEAVLAGLLRAGRQVKDLVVAERVAERAEYLANKYAIRIAAVGDAVENADFILIAVKPADVEPIVAAISRAASQAESDTVEKLVVSVVAGMTIAYYESRLPAGTPVIRAMPNAPALVRAGVTALAPGRFASAQQVEDVSALFECVGGVLIVSETQLDAVTAVSGSGPAYFFLFVEALVDAAVANGLTRATATELAVQTMAGSAAMLLERLEDQQVAGVIDGLDTTPARLRATVTSPGGTTAAGLRELEKGGLRAAVGAAVDSAKTRSEQLGITTE